MDNTLIQTVMATLKEGLERRLESGKAKMFIGVEGQVALMIDKLERWFETKDPNELDQLVLDGIIAMLIDELGSRNGKS